MVPRYRFEFDHTVRDMHEIIRAGEGAVLHGSDLLLMQRVVEFLNNEVAMNTQSTTSRIADERDEARTITRELLEALEAAAPYFAGHSLCVKLHEALARAEAAGIRNSSPHEARGVLQGHTTEAEKSKRFDTLEPVEARHLLEILSNPAALDEHALLAMDLHTLRATIREYRDEARAAIEAAGIRNGK